MRYGRLVSTLPIHEFLKVWRNAPPEARQAASLLRYNSLANVLVGCRSDPGHNYTALYVPDEEILFHRLSFPKAFGEKCVPPGGSSIMAEITANEGDGIWEMTDQALIERAIDEIERIGFVDRVETSSTAAWPASHYGYPVYDLDYRRNVTAMRESVASTGLRLLGRFAEFDYINSDVCVERAIRMANELAADSAGES